MPIVVSTKDCTALSDTELVEMADLCADRPPGGRGHAVTPSIIPGQRAFLSPSCRSSGEDGALPEQTFELAHQAVAAVHVELRRQAQDLGADMEQHR